jgi:hypothetical protein
VHRDQLIGAGVLDEAVEVVAHVAGRAHGRVPEHLVHVQPDGAGQQLISLLFGQVLRQAEAPAEQGDGAGPPDRLEGLLRGRRRVGGGHVDPGDHVRRLELR